MLYIYTHIKASGYKRRLQMILREVRANSMVQNMCVAEQQKSAQLYLLGALSGALNGRRFVNGL